MSKSQGMANDFINVEEARKAREELMRSIENGDLLIHGMRLDTIIGYVHEIRSRGQWTVEQQIADWSRIKALQARVEELEGVLGYVYGALPLRGPERLAVDAARLATDGAQDG